MKHLRKMRGHKLIKAPKNQIPENLKSSLETQAQTLIETVLKPSYITTSPESSSLNSIIDIYTEWQKHYFYFCAKYRCSIPENKHTGQIVSLSSESKFARLDYVGDVRFNLSYFSHLGIWEKIYIDLTISECMEAIKNEPFFYPSPNYKQSRKFAANLELSD